MLAVVWGDRLELLGTDRVSILHAVYIDIPQLERRGACRQECLKRQSGPGTKYLRDGSQAEIDLNDPAGGCFARRPLRLLPECQRRLPAQTECAIEIHAPNSGGSGPYIKQAGRIPVRISGSRSESQEHTVQCERSVELLSFTPVALTLTVTLSWKRPSHSTQGISICQLSLRARSCRCIVRVATLGPRSSIFSGLLTSIVTATTPRRTHSVSELSNLKDVSQTPASVASEAVFEHPPRNLHLTNESHATYQHPCCYDSRYIQCHSSALHRTFSSPRTPGGSKGMEKTHVIGLFCAFDKDGNKISIIDALNKLAPGTLVECPLGVHQQIVVLDVPDSEATRASPYKQSGTKPVRPTPVDQATIEKQKGMANTFTQKLLATQTSMQAASTSKLRCPCCQRFHLMRLPKTK
ncbi:hypothetical protein C8F01DRAFT_1234308 [Mycena amicta]|nr:hypothetical protein C8F01DRAFT_1234308 [Mycena amicta]